MAAQSLVHHSLIPRVVIEQEFWVHECPQQIILPDKLPCLLSLIGHDMHRAIVVGEAKVVSLKVARCTTAASLWAKPCQGPVFFATSAPEVALHVQWQPPQGHTTNISGIGHPVYQRLVCRVVIADLIRDVANVVVPEVLPAWPRGCILASQGEVWHIAIEGTC